MKRVVKTLEMAFHSFDEYGDIIVIVLPRFVAVEGELVDEITHLCAEVARAVKHASLMFELMD